MLVNCAFTSQPIYIFVFAYANCRFSHDAAHLRQNKTNRKFFFLFFVEPNQQFFSNIGTDIENWAQIRLMNCKLILVDMCHYFVKNCNFIDFVLSLGTFVIEKS